MKTALYAGDNESFEATIDDIRNPDLKPDRLITKLDQVLNILEIN
jgi:hypothetical protein